MSRAILVTGVSGAGVALVARTLASRAAEYGVNKVVGVDTTLPTGDLGGVKFVRADIRTPVIGKVLAVEDIETVVHLATTSNGSRSAGSKELNVIGTMQVLAAAQRSDTVRRFVLGSHVAVYGGSPRDPAIFTESMTAKSGVSSGFAKDCVEIEGYTRGFARRRPDITVTTLRLAHMATSRFATIMGDHFSHPVIPAVAGFDPRLQLLHLDDALDVIALAAFTDRPGTFNVAGDGVVTLSQAARMMGKPVVPMVTIGGVHRFSRTLGLDIKPDLAKVLTYGRAVQTTALQTIFGYQPRFSTRETFEEFCSSSRPGIFQLAGRLR